MADKEQVADPERESLIQEMLREQKSVEVPGSDETQNAPMVMKELSSAGYKYLWDSKTFEKVPILYYMLPAKMRQKNSDGTFRFTGKDPKQLPWRGSLKCHLHKDDEQRRHYSEMGFRFCTKDNITNPYELIRHMQLKHSKEWASIENERKEKERLEDRDLQHAVLKQMTSGGATKPPLYVSNKDKKNTK